jgi:hypothetical protein
VKSASATIGFSSAAKVTARKQFLAKDKVKR